MKNYLGPLLVLALLLGGCGAFRPRNPSDAAPAKDHAASSSEQGVSKSDHK